MLPQCILVLAMSVNLAVSFTPPIRLAIVICLLDNANQYSLFTCRVSSDGVMWNYRFQYDAANSIVMSAW